MQIFCICALCDKLIIIIIIIIIPFRNFHCSLSRWFLTAVWVTSRSLQVSRSPLIILADLNNALVWMIFTLPLISKSSRPCTNLWVIVLKAPITFYMNATFMLRRFFDSLARSKYLSFFSLSFNFSLCSARTAKLLLLLLLLLQII